MSLKNHMVTINSMDLFDFDSTLNLLPYDGEVNYFPQVVTGEECDFYYKALADNSDWKNDVLLINGKQLVTRRKVAWYGDDNYEYIYSGSRKYAQPWTQELLQLKALVETICQSSFNSCLLNLYHSGDEGMSWHSDKEIALLKNATIASLSFGAERKFSFKHKSSMQTLSIMLQQGSLLLMKGSTQSHWQHALPKVKNLKAPRINLTFRCIDETLQE